MSSCLKAEWRKLLKPQKYLETNEEHYFFYHFRTFLKVCIMNSRFCVWTIFYFDFYGRLFTILLILFRFPRILCCSGIKGRPEDSNGQVSSPLTVCLTTENSFVLQIKVTSDLRKSSILQSILDKRSC